MALQGALDATKVLEEYAEKSGIMDRKGEPFRFSTADSHHWSFHVHRDPKSVHGDEGIATDLQTRGVNSLVKRLWDCRR